MSEVEISRYGEDLWYAFFNRKSSYDNVLPLSLRLRS